MYRRVDIPNVDKPTKVKFSYSVEWYEEPELRWKDRMTRYAGSIDCELICSCSSSDRIPDDHSSSRLEERLLAVHGT